jgi:hypothetical protein
VATIPQDIDDTARLLLMEQPDLDLIALHRALQSEGCQVSPVIVSDLWTKYRGWDGRTLPTHSVETGRRINTVSSGRRV